LGPTMWRSESSEEAGCASKDNPEIPVVRTAPAFRKFLRLGKHWVGNIAVSFQRTSSGVFREECRDNTAGHTAEQAPRGRKKEASDRQRKAATGWRCPTAENCGNEPLAGYFA
jgi:hypothetical protein